MKAFFRLLLVFLTCSIAKPSIAQVDADQLGAWYMYFFDAKLNAESKFGIQGDIQFRNWDLGGDLEQLLLRGGLTYRPNTDVKLTLGYGNITSGAFGDSDATSSESRIYQEALLPQKVGKIISLTHRFRYEQRFVDDQDFRTRYRYNLFANIPLNNTSIEKGTVYLALYNELFINGQRSIGEGVTVELFDRNRTYGALGYGVSPKLNVQIGIMRQTSDSYAKNQIQLSLHQKF